MIAAQLEAVGIDREIRRSTSPPGSTGRATASSTPSCWAGSATSTRTTSTTRSTTPTADQLPGLLQPRGRRAARRRRQRDRRGRPQGALRPGAKIIVDDASYIYLYNPDVVQAWTAEVQGYEAARRPGDPLRRRLAVELTAGEPLRPAPARAGGRRAARASASSSSRSSTSSRATRSGIALGTRFDPGDLRGAAGAGRARPAAARAVLSVPRPRAHRRPRRELPQRRAGHAVARRAAAGHAVAGAGVCSSPCSSPCRSGIVSALRSRLALDYVATAASQVGVSVPDFWMAIMFILLFSLRARLAAPVGLRAADRGPGRLGAATWCCRRSPWGWCPGSILTRFVRSARARGAAARTTCARAQPRVCRRPSCCAPRPAQRAAADRHGHRRAAGLPARRRRRRGDRLRLAGDRPARPDAVQARDYPRAAGRRAVVRRAVPRHQPARRPALRRARPEDPDADERAEPRRGRPPVARAARSRARCSPTGWRCSASLVLGPARRGGASLGRRARAVRARTQSRSPTGCSRRAASTGSAPTTSAATCSAGCSWRLGASLQVGLVAVGIALARRRRRRPARRLLRRLGRRRRSCALMDMLFAFPAILLAIAILAVLGPGLDERDDRHRRRLHADLRPDHPRRRCWPCARRSTSAPPGRSAPRDPRILRRHVLPNVVAADHRADLAEPRLRHPLRGGAVLPRPRRAAAAAVVGADARRRPRLHRAGLVDGLLPRPRRSSSRCWRSTSSATRCATRSTRGSAR